VASTTATIPFVSIKMSLATPLRITITVESLPGAIKNIVLAKIEVRQRQNFSDSKVFLARGKVCRGYWSDIYLEKQAEEKAF
jgi:hypothetical protein